MNITPCPSGTRLRDYLHGTWVEAKQVKSIDSAPTSSARCISEKSPWGRHSGMSVAPVISRWRGNRAEDSRRRLQKVVQARCGSHTHLACCIYFNIRRQNALNAFEYLAAKRCTRMINTASELNYAELARQIAARMSPEALLSAEDVGAMLGYPARYIRETIALAPGFPVAIRLRLNSDGKRSNPRWRRTDIEKWVTTHRSQRPTRAGRPRQQIQM